MEDVNKVYSHAAAVAHAIWELSPDGRDHSVEGVLRALGHELFPEYGKSFDEALDCEIAESRW